MIRDRKPFAQIAIALLLVSIFTALPIATTFDVATVGEVYAIPLSNGFEAAEEYPPGKIFADFVGGRVAFDQDMINIEQIAHPNDKWYGRGVVVAVLDSGLLPNWDYFFPRNRIITELGIGFEQDFTTGEIITVPWDDAVHGHGTHVASTIIGYNFRGTPITGVAPLAKIIPVKVLSYYDSTSGRVWGTWKMIAAGVDYITSLVQSGMFEPGKVIINLSLGGGHSPIMEEAVNRAIAAGVIVVACAGNSGSLGMWYPGGYSQVISVGSAGWTGQWYPIDPATGRENRNFVWNDVPEDLNTPAPASQWWGYHAGRQLFINTWSSRELAGQDLDVVAPGSWIVGPYWTPLWGPLPEDPRLCYGIAFGTSMATPHVAGTAALLAEKRGAKLTQNEVEILLETVAYKVHWAPPNSWGWPSATLPYMAIYIDVQPTRYTWAEWDIDAVGEGFLQTHNVIIAIGG